MSRRCSFLISKAWAKLYQKLYRVELIKERKVFTFLTDKNQLPFSFFCAKYRPKVNTVSTEYVKEFNIHFETYNVSLVH